MSKEENKEYLEPVDHTIPDYSFKVEQEKFYVDFKSELCRRLQPVVQNLTDYLRALEKNTKNAGFDEIKKMLKEGDINEQMFDILFESLGNLEGEYTVELESSKYFKQQ